MTSYCNALWAPVKSKIASSLRGYAHDRITLYSAALSASFFILAAIGSYLAVSDSFAYAVSGMVDRGSFSKHFIELCLMILAVNYSTMLFLFSGTFTLGVSTLVGIFLSGSFLGISVRVAITHNGVGKVLMQTLLYTPWEIIGFIMAGAAGFYPCIYVLICRRCSSALGLSIKRSLFLLAVAAFILLVAAILESLSIVLGI